MALEGYQDIDRYVTNQNANLDKQLQTMNDISDQSVQLQTERLARQKEDIDRETVQQNRAIYQDYRKNSNPFGVQAENLASQGLGNSGYAETTQARLYNTYQNNITATLNTARQLKADVDFAINEATRTGDITKGENAIKIYAQRMQLNAEEFDMRNNREQLLYNRQYQKERDAIEDNWRQKEWNYTLKRDKEDDKWKKKQYKNEEKWRQKEWNYKTKKSSATSSRVRSSGSGSKKKGNGDQNSNLNPEDKKNNNSKATNKIAETALKALGNSKLVKLLTTGAKELAKPIIMGGVLKYQQTKGKEGISEKQAEALFDKYGL